MNILEVVIVLQFRIQDFRLRKYVCIYVSMGCAKLPTCACWEAGLYLWNQYKIWFFDTKNSRCMDI